MAHRAAGIIILAGGTARRLGGVSKPDFKVAGRRLIDILFDQLDIIGFTGRRVVVAPGSLAVPSGVVLTLEEPPHGGPVAGIGAGLAEMVGIDDDALLALATCDAPAAVRLLPQLAEQLRQPRDGVVPLTDAGWPLYVHGLYRAGALRTLSYERGVSVRRTFGGLDVATTVDADGHSVDVDEPADVPRLIAHLHALGAQTR